MWHEPHAARCRSQPWPFHVARTSSVGSPRRITTLANCAPMLVYRCEWFRPLPRDAPPLAARSGLIFLIPGGVCKVAAVVVTEGVDVATDVFPEAVKGVEALNSRLTSLLTFCWFNIANSARNP